MPNDYKYGKPKDKSGFAKKQTNSKDNFGKSTYSKPDGAPARYSKPDGAPGRYAKPGGTPGQFAKPDGAPGRTAKPDGTPGQYSKPAGAPGRYAKSGGAPGRYGKPGGAPARYAKPAPQSSKPKEDTRGARANESDTREDMENNAVPGRNAVKELLKSGRDIEKVFVREGDREGSITVLVAETLKRGIPLVETTKARLDVLCGYEQHQGIVAIASEKNYVEVDELLAIAEERGEKPLIIIADGITDPHNLGAVIRCAEGAGAHGIIIPKRRAAGVTPAVAKASAGAVEHLAIAKCSNVSDTVRKLKDKGLWIFAAEAGGTDYGKADFTLPCAIVLGSEENGVSEIVKRNCDFTVSIPMLGKVNSLNVSTASAVLLYEAIRQRAKQQIEVK